MTGATASGVWRRTKRSRYTVRESLGAKLATDNSLDFLSGYRATVGGRRTIVLGTGSGRSPGFDSSRPSGEALDFAGLLERVEIAQDSPFRPDVEHLAQLLHTRGDAMLGQPSVNGSQHLRLCELPSPRHRKRSFPFVSRGRPGVNRRGPHHAQPVLPV